MKNLIGMLLLCCSATTYATVIVADAYIFIPLPGQRMTVAYAQLQNTGVAEEQLVAVSVPTENTWADTIEMHQHIHADGVMSMRELPVLPIAAGKQEAFSTGGYHLMVIGAHDLIVGKKVPMVLHWRNGQSQQVMFDVRER